MRTILTSSPELRTDCYAQYHVPFSEQHSIVVLSVFTSVPHTEAQTLIVVLSTLTRTMGYKVCIFYPNKRKDL
jgi:hypothetical protein